MVDLFHHAAATLGESPRAYEDSDYLYWVDIPARRLHRTQIAAAEDEMLQLDQQIGCVAACANGGFMLAMESGFFHMAKWGAKPQPFGEQILADQPHLRFNDGCVDPKGRWWVGTVTADKSRPDAALYCLTSDGQIRKIFGELLTSNGAAFSADHKYFYHADTPTHALHIYPYDRESGSLGEGRILHQFEHGTGRPDGGAADEEGCYWTALFDGGRVERLSPEGKILESINVPAKRPTMISFGGKDRKTAFITSATTGLSDDILKAQPHSGGIFTFTTKVAGVRNWKFAL